MLVRMRVRKRVRRWGRGSRLNFGAVDTFGAFIVHVCLFNVFMYSFQSSDALDGVCMHNLLYATLICFTDDCTT
jgi:hypothetical protein